MQKIQTIELEDIDEVTIYYVGPYVKFPISAQKMLLHSYDCKFHFRGSEILRFTKLVNSINKFNTSKTSDFFAEKRILFRSEMKSKSMIDIFVTLNSDYIKVKDIEYKVNDHVLSKDIKNIIYKYFK